MYFAVIPAWSTNTSWYLPEWSTCQRNFRSVRLGPFNKCMYFSLFVGFGIFTKLNFSQLAWIPQDGKRELFETGQWLRTRYGNFLGDTYHPDVSHAAMLCIRIEQVSCSAVRIILFVRAFYIGGVGPNDWCNTHKNVNAIGFGRPFPTTWHPIRVEPTTELATNSDLFRAPRWR